MYVELKTDVDELIIDLLRKSIKDGKAVRIALDRANNLHRLSLSEISPEPMISGTIHECECDGRRVAEQSADGRHNDCMAGSALLSRQ